MPGRKFVKINLHGSPLCEASASISLIKDFNIEDFNKRF